MRVGKVYKNIYDSEFMVEFGRFTFQFSSKYYYLRFLSELDDYIGKESIRLNHKYGKELELNEYFALILYKKIEKRGFSVLFEKQRIEPGSTFRLSLSVANKF